MLTIKCIYEFSEYINFKLYTERYYNPFNTLIIG